MRFLIMALFLSLFAPAASAGALVSLEDAEKLLLENNLDIKIKNAELKKTEAGILEAKAFPNPVLQYGRESVKNGMEETEETFSLSQSLNLSGKRGKRIEAAELTRDARALLLKQEIRGIATLMKQSYCRALLLKENDNALAGTIELFSDVKEKMDARFLAGDVSEAQVLKLAAELSGFMRNRDRVRLELKTELLKLRLFLNLDEDFELADDFTYTPRLVDAHNLAKQAPANRPDIKGQEATVRAAEAAVSLAKREAIPDIEIEAGVRQRNGESGGFVFGISVPLPLFSRNQGGAGRARAELLRERLQYDSIKKRAVSEVENLSETLTALGLRVTDLARDRETSRELTKIARIAYEEGETSLLELLDAARTEKDVYLEYNNTVYEYYHVLFELEQASGANLMAQGETL